MEKEWIKAKNEPPKVGSYIVCRYVYNSFQRVYLAVVEKYGIRVIDQYANQICTLAVFDEIPDNLYYHVIPNLK